MKARIEDMGRKEKKEEIKTKLDMMNRSAGRTPMPRPAVFKDKTKYNRNRAKVGFHREYGTRCFA